MAFVVLVKGSDPSAAGPDTILESLRARLVHYKCPREIHFVEELPKTATGKIQRFLLRERVASTRPIDANKKKISERGERSRRDR